ncbi:DNA repair protein RecN [Parvibaculum sp.]|jgi:DNA repair protein RecN (Recombination protein N)|uniref:DNA repair protein RecN n=1 Tax=Parvibaculum sp. TaxID=2024848 RepID=UPI000C5AC5F8|nr:DNA repair protein RecN [Parvibaculum sp.]MAM94204.1 DNA repair protein RecN [Parvibaculum sp.]|tara:strand:+ start:2477 stop:4168 length:1692 start_codon:yes stop_codon:yes gene_type:complete
MLAALSIRDIVLIDRLELSLDEGLCTLTGETGAGKSILLDSLGLAIGARADAGLVRQGAEQGSVTAVFDLTDSHPARALLDENGIEAEGDLILRRVQTKDGRSRAFVNDQAVSVGLLRQLGDMLVEIHGQHDERGLLDASGHRAILDAFGGLEPKVQQVRKLHAAAAAAREALAEHEAALAKAKAEQDYLTHVVGELDELAPEPGEETALAEERALMMHSEKIAGDLSEAEQALSGDGGLDARLNIALRRLSRVAEQAGGRLDAAIAALDRTLVEAAEARDQVALALRAMEFDPARLEHVETRLFALRAAARKHNVQVDSLAALAEKLRGQLQEIEGGEAKLGSLRKAADEAGAAYLTAAKALSDARIKAAAKLDKQVMKELVPLKLDKASFKTQVDVLPEDQLGGPEGIDRVSFLVSTNPGAPHGPLIKIASGGELSRFVLALKVALASRGSAPTLIFDEVDAGVGGAVAEAVGLRLAELAGEVQVLVVTHSPQVAARAQHHFRISKSASGETKAKKDAPLATRVETLDAAARREEIARMLAGATVTDEARAAADRLIGGQS